MRPFRGSLADRRPADQPLFHYPYVEWRAALGALARSAEIGPHLRHALEFRNPADGGSIIPTIPDHVVLLPWGYYVGSVSWWVKGFQFVEFLVVGGHIQK